MKAINLNANSALWTSVILHLALLVAFFLIALVKALLPKEPVHVFEMVSEPAPENKAQSSEPMEPVPDFIMPEVKPLKIPDPVMPKAQPIEKPIEPTVEQPPVKPSVKPSVKPAPVKPEKEQLMSYADFIKDNPVKKPKPRKTQPHAAHAAHAANVHVPKINTEKFSANLISKLTTVENSATNTLTAVERSALQRYGDQLNGRLNRAWIKPVNLSGLNLIATVVFDVSSSGRISNIRFQPGSGNTSFDESVKAAFTKVGSGGTTPTGQGHTFTMSFRMVN